MKIFFKVMDYNKIWTLINRDKLSKSAAARIAGMTHQGFMYMMDRKTMTVDALEKYANHFKLPVSHFFELNDTDLVERVEEPMTKLYRCKSCEEKERTIQAQRETIDIQDRYITTLEEQVGKKDLKDLG